MTETAKGILLMHSQFEQRAEEMRLQAHELLKASFTLMLTRQIESREGQDFMRYIELRDNGSWVVRSYAQVGRWFQIRCPRWISL